MWRVNIKTVPRFKVVLDYSIWIVLLLVFCGCEGNTSGRLAIRGEVTLDGVPLDTGSIIFSPANEERFSSGAVIEEGRFEIIAAKGLAPGSYFISIQSADEEAPKEKIAMPGPGIPVNKERIPPDYNIDSKHVVEVTKDGPNEFRFDIRTSENNE